MKIISSIFLMLAFSLCAQEQENEFAQILSIKNINPSEMQDFCTGKQKEMSAKAKEETSPKAIAMESSEVAKDSYFLIPILFPTRSSMDILSMWQTIWMEPGSSPAWMAI